MLSISFIFIFSLLFLSFSRKQGGGEIPPKKNEVFLSLGLGVYFGVFVFFSSFSFFLFFFFIIITYLVMHPFFGLYVSSHHLIISSLLSYHIPTPSLLRPSFSPPLFLTSPKIPLLSFPSTTLSKKKKTHTNNPPRSNLPPNRAPHSPNRAHGQRVQYGCRRARGLR